MRWEEEAEDISETRIGLDGARAALWLVPISPAAADQWQRPYARMIVADQPDATGILRGIEAFLGRRESPEQSV